MSENSTFKTSVTSVYLELLGAIDSIAGECGLRMTECLPIYYRTQRTSIGLKARTTIADSDGSIENFETKPIIITGWSLRTTPFFISDPRNEFRAVVFLTDHADRVEPIYPHFLETKDAEFQPPTIDQLRDVHHELTRILTLSS